jgi:hypothetical protein
MHTCPATNPPEPARGRLRQPLLPQQRFEGQAQQAQHGEGRALLGQPDRRLGPINCTQQKQRWRGL